jgi:hypothetical protein
MTMMMAAAVVSQELAPTDQTTFSYPDDGAGVELPFPSQIASLTGESGWPTIWVTPPFTPNMAALFNPSATTIIPDITVPPGANGNPSSGQITANTHNQTFFKRLTMVRRT